MLDAGDPEQKIFIAKFNTDGMTLWAKEVGSGGYYGSGEDIAVDDNGNAHIVGYYRGGMNLGVRELNYNSNQRYSLLVVKYDRDGNIVWATDTEGAERQAVGKRICLDAGGNAFITGGCNASTLFGSIPMSGDGGSDHNAFIARLNSTGNFTLAKPVSASTSITGNGIALTHAGDCIITGSFQDTLRIGTEQLIGSGGSDMFVAELHVGTSGVDMTGKDQPSTLLISPNPAGDLVRLSGSALQGRMEVFSADGIRVLDTAAGKELDIRDLPAGIYFLRVDGGVRKLIKVGE